MNQFGFLFSFYFRPKHPKASPKAQYYHLMLAELHLLYHTMKESSLAGVRLPPHATFHNGTMTVHKPGFMPQKRAEKLNIVLVLWMHSVARNILL